MLEQYVNINEVGAILCLMRKEGPVCYLSSGIGVKYQLISRLVNSWVQRYAVTTRQELRILLNYKTYIHLTNLTPEFSIYLQDLRKILNNFSTTSKQHGLYVNSYLIPPNKNIKTEVILLQGALWIFFSQEATVNASLIKGCVGQRMTLEKIFKFYQTQKGPGKTGACCQSPVPNCSSADSGECYAPYSWTL